MINAVLIDDEKNALEMLEWQLQTYCPDVHIAALCKAQSVVLKPFSNTVRNLYFWILKCL